MISDQEIFTKVSRHLLAQNKKSEGFIHHSVSSQPVFSCLYRGEDGTKCAVGCLIPDDKYKADLEGRGVESQAVLDALGLDVYRNEGQTFDLLIELQRIHDNIAVDGWERALRAAGRKRELIWELA